MSQYEENRSRIPFAELVQYAGQWVAFRSDGSCIVASAPTLAALEQRLIEQDEQPEKLAFEYLEFEDSVVGGSELY